MLPVISNRLPQSVLVSCLHGNLSALISCPPAADPSSSGQLILVSFFLLPAVTKEIMPSWLCCTHAPRSKPEEIYQMTERDETTSPEGHPPHIRSAPAPLPVPTVEVTAPEPPQPQFSWDKRERIDLSKESIIIVKGNTSAVTIDDCSDSLIILGPCSGSVFIRDCFNCSLLSVCGQLRTRDCHNLELVLRCASEPIIEQSSDVTLRPLCLFYPELKEHMKRAGLDVFRNQAVSIHDFTANQMKSNFKVEKKTINLTEKGLSVLAGFEIFVDPSRSLFPAQLNYGTSLCFAYRGVGENSEAYQEDRQKLIEELNACPQLSAFYAVDLEMPSWDSSSLYDQLPLPTHSFARISLVGCSGWRDSFEAVILKHGKYTLVPAEECDNMEKRLFDAGLLEN